jgi:alkylation response protein AidB-like acyl-CoA dehydrogenase
MEAEPETKKYEISYNVVPEACGQNFFRADPNLRFILRRILGQEDLALALPHLDRAGDLAGNELDDLARIADKNPPQLVQYDRSGRRVDEIIYHPAYLEMWRIACEELALNGMSHRPALGWKSWVPHTVKYALSYLFVQAEFGLLCPVSMTDSLARVLRLFAEDDIKNRYLPRLTATRVSELWQGAMGLTERTGGSDVGSSRTVACREGVDWRLYGEKWFCSNASADVILTLARPEGAPSGTRGLALFLVPKRLENGRRNHYRINRLKDKLGTRDMATGEITYEGAIAYQVGQPEKGFKQMAEMINVSRLSNAMRSAGMMRRAFLEALITARQRSAFKRPLIEHALMRKTLLDLLLDVEACTALVFQASSCLDCADHGSKRDRNLVRVLTPMAKFYVTKRARYVTGEAMEVLGGNGYIEDFVTPRLVRDSHLGSIWEGASNVVALDVLRAMDRENCLGLFFDDVSDRLKNLQNTTVRRAGRIAERVRTRLLDQVEEMLAQEGPRREVASARLITQSVHLNAATLLLEEADHQATESQSYRKLLVAATYLYEHFGSDPLASYAADAAALNWLEALIDWQSVPAEASELVLELLEKIRPQG